MPLTACLFKYGLLAFAVQNGCQNRFRRNGGPRHGGIIHPTLLHVRSARKYWIDNLEGESSRFLQSTIVEYRNVRQNYPYSRDGKILRRQLFRWQVLASVGNGQWAMGLVKILEAFLCIFDWMHFSQLGCLELLGWLVWYGPIRIE